MGTHTSADMAPFSCFLYETESTSKEYIEDLEENDIREIEQVEDNEDQFERLNDYIELSCNGGVKIKQPINGWTYIGSNSLTKKKRLHGAGFIKGEYEVSLLNTNEYSMVGYVTMVVVSKSKESIQEFLKDFGIEESEEHIIEEDDAVTVTD